VIQAHASFAEAPAFHFVLHVRAREDGGGQADKCGEHHQVDIEGVDVEELLALSSGPLSYTPKAMGSDKASVTALTPTFSQPPDGRDR